MRSVADMIDYIGWVKRGNSRWIVHRGLGKNAEAYMQHLERHDRKRLALSCRNAYLLVQQSDPMEDPKPWFYTGLFSLVKPEEAREHLADHWLLTMSVGVITGQAATLPLLDSVSDNTLDKIRRIREAVDRLPVEE
jgi:hypothetical protein